MRRTVPKVLVVLTDGRSQDEVKKSAEKLQHSGRQRATVGGAFNLYLPPKLIRFV